MKDIWQNIKSKAKQNIGEIVLFSYALVLGTSLPLALSRCSANCLNCGSCTLYLGIIPIIAAVALRNKIKRIWEHIIHSVSRITRTALRKGYE
jgi:hypothetical protein